MIQHVVCQRDLTSLVANDGELQGGVGELVDILDPLMVVIDVVGRQTNQLDASFGKLGFQLCERSQLGRTHWSKVFWMREKHDPFVADELVEVDRSIRRFRFEVGGSRSKAQTVTCLASCIHMGHLDASELDVRCRAICHFQNMLF